MAELPLDQAVPRFKANEDRLDTFVNSATGYTTSGGVSVQSIQQFLASIGSNGIDFVDNAKARFGTGNDLEIYHSGSGSFIRDTGTGDLTIDGSAISIQTASAERVSVTASGIDVTGTVEFDGLSGTGAVTITDIADEDNMASNSATKLATQQSIKAYVDTQVATIPTGDITSVVAGTGLTGGGTTGDVTLNIGAGTGITVNADDIAIDATVATLTGTQTFTNKTLTSAVLNTSVSGTAVLDEDDMTSNSATKLATQQSIKAYVDANVGGGGLPTTGGTMTGDILFNDGIKAKFGNSSDLQIWHNGTDSYVYDTGEGDLILRGSSNIKLQSSGGTALSTFTAAGASTLYYSAAEKLATTSTGIGVTGKIGVGDAGTVADHELHIQSASPTIRLEDTDGNKRFDITQSGNDTNLDYETNMLFKKSDGTEIFRIDTAGVDVTGAIDVATSGASNTSSGLAIATSGTNFESDGGIISIDHAASGAVTGGYFSKYSAGGTLRHSVKGDGKGYFAGGLDVTGATNTTGTSGTRQWSAGSAGQKLGIYSYENSTFYHRLETGNATNYQWGTYDNIPIYTITNNTIRTTLTGDGKFGVGSTSPTSLMHLASTAPYITFEDTDNNQDWQIQATAWFAIRDQTANAERMRIDSSGRVGIGHTSPVAKMAILGSSNSTITEANSNLCVEGSGGNGLLFGTLNTTGFKSYIQSGFVANLGTATYDLLLNPEGGNVGVGLTAPTAKMHLFTDGIDQSVFSAQTDLGTNNRILTLKSPVSDSSSAPYRWQTSNSIQWEIDSTESKSMILNSAGLLGIGTYSPNHEIHIESTSPTIRLVDTDNNNTVDFTQSGSATYIDFDNNVRFRNLANVERLRIDSNGIDVTGDLTVSSTIEVGSLTPNQDGAIEVGVIALGTPAISSTTDSTSLRNHIIFDNPNGAVGKINTLNSATSYLTSSDYRLKTDVQEMTGSIDRVKALRPVNFEWVVDGTRVDGFLAHEAQEVVPEAVDGEKDAMRDKVTIITPLVEATYDEEGNELTPEIPAVTETEQVPDYQGIDQSKIVPLLTSALQDAISKIEALETRLEALEA